MAVRGRFVRLLFHTREERGMTLIPHATRCISRHEIHEIVTTDQRGLTAGDRIDRVGFLGFVEIERGGVLERGDRAHVGGVEIGRVVGFDECHFPNHYNVVLETARPLSADAIELEVGYELVFEPADEPPAELGEEPRHQEGRQ